MIEDVRCPRCGGPMTVRLAKHGRNAGKSFLGCIRFPQCRGSADFPDFKEKGTKALTPSESVAVRATSRRNAAPSDSRGRLQPGDLVVSSSNELGPCKVVSLSGADALVKYFDHPGQLPGNHDQCTVPQASLTRLPLNHETRVFWEKNTRWVSGRIVHATEERDIQVRAHEWEGFVDEKRLFVRWQRPLTDPVGFAAVGLLESPLLADRRRPFLQSLLRQRAASHGMSGVLSSSVELHAHQVEIARRVLEDPVQRYLLADEVGLGKTVEAGMVIRQLLLDYPSLSVQLILPPHLREQWMRELESKFHVRTFPNAVLRFSRDDRPEEWAPADLVVVDEAHHLAQLSASRDGSLAARYRRLQDVALESKRLLLLSATPVLHNEAVLLAMLRLLDPRVYNTSDVSALRERVEARSNVGRILLGLRPGLPAVLLRKRLSELTDLYPQDPDVNAIGERISQGLGLGDTEDVNEALRSMRIHVSEVYRLHRRMLRTRRTAALSETYRVTGRRAPSPRAIDPEVSQQVELLLDGWRQELLAAAEGAGGSMDEAVQAFATACELAYDPPGLASWAQMRCEEDVSVGEREALERLARGLGRISRQDQVARPIADALTFELAQSERMVVFCATTELARDLVREMQQLVGEELVSTHLEGDDPAATEATVRDFENPQGTSRILVCDVSAEEGRNFQFVDVLVHLGLPSNANRLEQRIGRFDRWSADDKRSPWRSLVVSDTEIDITILNAWRQILAEGFEVFDRSIASLQHAVEVASTTAWALLLQHGPAGATPAIGEVHDLLSEEAERIREQDALDAIEAVQDDRSVFSAIEQSEAQEDHFAATTDDLLAERGDMGNLRFQRIRNPALATGSYLVRGRDRNGNLLLPLLPTWRIARDLVPLEGQSVTFRREVAVQQPGTHLLRYGSPLIDAVADFLWHDDRGRAFGIWRWIPGWDRPERAVYRFDYHVEASPDLGSGPSVPDGDLEDSKTVQRRTDALFPPVIVSLWVGHDLQPVTDETFLSALTRPYRKPLRRDDPQGGDFSLNAQRIHWAYDLIAQGAWELTWRKAEAVAREFVQAQPDVVNRIAKGAALARQLLEQRLHQLQLRAARVDDDERATLEYEINREEALAQATKDAIAVPDLRLDSTGIVIISGEVPLRESQL